MYSIMDYKSEETMPQASFRKNSYIDLPNIVEVLIDGKMTIMSAVAFDQYLREEAEKSYAEWKSGKAECVPAEQVFAELRKKYGLREV